MVQGIAGRRKRYVEVEAEFLSDGVIVPRAVMWHDGRRFPVRAVLGMRRCASLKVGGEGVRYDVLVGHARTFLFHEGPRWFVEEIVPEGEGPGAGPDAAAGQECSAARECYSGHS
ncbi:MULTISPECIES: outer dense fiber protein 1 [Gordonibacter]|uniref:Outer dense fiber protein 1 n=1 Tax=Gordonibacter faecis TaxID=3047475 RepID=A0ABT7DQJ7_9ACTN|nr:MULTISPECIES: outer dense fiber protein 1 [unclassified Gordonibacter]MDJ1651824.1 outer dense fiber protein 1 [Gordonibacter sp. KGMB12511]